MTEKPARGGERSRAKTRVIYYAAQEQFDDNAQHWGPDEVRRDLATVIGWAACWRRQETSSSDSEGPDDEGH
eukprot:1209619-Lingulodinium_polyedra.AAC.1